MQQQSIRPRPAPAGPSPRLAEARPASLPAARRAAARRREKRRKQLASLGVMLVLVLVLLAVALLLTREGEAAAPSASVPPASAPVVSAPPVSVPVSSAPPVPVRAPTPYDEAAAPLLLNHIGDNPIPQDYTLDLIDVGNSQQLQRRAAEAFLAMQAAAEEDGIGLRPLSGYRSHSLQTNIYQNKLNLYMNQGMTREKAEYETLRYHAYPGTSEHEAGLAMDIGDLSASGTDIEDSFDETPAFAWLQKNAAAYGFIFRYRAETEAITGIAYEPWHYRYTGANHAERMAEEGFTTLEEYLEEEYHVEEYQAEKSQASGVYAEEYQGNGPD